jgi:hypothetical protein
MSYTKLFYHLMKLKFIELRTWKVDPNKLPKSFNSNARCIFHSNGQGHTIENCMAFKHTVQDLLDFEAFNFGPAPTSDATQQPLPTHVDATVNAIGKDGSLDLVKGVNMLTTPLSFVKERLLRKGVFPGCGINCEDCMIHPEGCKSLRDKAQDLLDAKVIRFTPDGQIWVVL